jgi:phosphoribosylamine--glycine ligase
MEMLNVLIVGSGGREHALTWKAAQSPRRARLYIAPGNAGTAQVGENVAIHADTASGIGELIAFARHKQVDLVIVGPEAPLAAGITNALQQAKIAVFGPTRQAAQLETSKAFAKLFMLRYGIPTARAQIFTNFEQASHYLDSVDYPVVIKASGLAAGKGVIVPEAPEGARQALRQMLLEHEFGSAGDEVLVEEQLSGPEVSVLAFCDGENIRVMPPAQDHKRLLVGDQGPNTGGMGAYAPAPVCTPALLDEIKKSVLQPTIDGLRTEGAPYVGVLYAGMMLTKDGPKVLEFNCRFGDPETQALLPLLQTDFLDIAEACAQGRLDDLPISWRVGASVCVVLAAGGYPGKSITGKPISGLDSVFEDAVVFHAGTRKVGDAIITTGGRVLGVTGWSTDLPGALARAYAAVDQLKFEGMQYRRDIGWLALSFRG